MTKKKLILTLAMTTILVALFETNNAYAQTTVVGTDPSLCTAETGFTFTLDINITDVYNLYAWEFNMTFNPNILNVTNIVEGWFLSDWATTKWNAPNIQNELGWLAAGCIFWTPYPSHGADGGGVLATITFKVSNYGRSDLHFVWTKLRTWNGQLLVPIDHTARDGVFDNRLPGDVDGDRDVDYDDFIVLAGAYGSTSGQPAYKRNADFDQDGDVDYDDFIKLAGNYGKRV